MRVIDVLKKENMKVPLEGRSKLQIIRELVDLVLLQHSEQAREEAYRAVLEREKLSSTGVGEGVAIPHATVDLGDDLLVGFGLTEEPVEFDAIDGHPVRLFFLILCPHQQRGRLIRFLARISRILHHEAELKYRLLECVSADEVFSTIEGYENLHFG